MTETEYVLARDLTRIRDALMLLREACLSHVSSDASTPEEFQEALSSLTKLQMNHASRLEAVMKHD